MQLREIAEIFRGAYASDQAALLFGWMVSCLWLPDIRLRYGLFPNCYVSGADADRVIRYLLWMSGGLFTPKVNASEPRRTIRSLMTNVSCAPCWIHGGDPPNTVTATRGIIVTGSHQTPPTAMQVYLNCTDPSVWMRLDAMADDALRAFTVISDQRKFLAAQMSNVLTTSIGMARRMGHHTNPGAVGLCMSGYHVATTGDSTNIQELWPRPVIIIPRTHAEECLSAFWAGCKEMWEAGEMPSAAWAMWLRDTRDKWGIDMSEMRGHFSDKAALTHVEAIRFARRTNTAIAQANYYLGTVMQAGLSKPTQRVITVLHPDLAPEWLRGVFIAAPAHAKPAGSGGIGGNI